MSHRDRQVSAAEINADGAKLDVKKNQFHGKSSESDNRRKGEAITTEADLRAARAAAPRD